MIININTHNIDYQLKSMQDYMLDYENKVNSLENIVSDIKNIWNGNDYNYFVQQMDSFFKELRQVKNSINTYTEFLRGYSDAVNELENYYSAKKINIK